MKFEEINFAYAPNPTSSFDDVQNPFTIAFCYPRKGEPFVLKGGWVDIEKFLLNKKQPLVAHITYWWRKSHRTLVQAYSLTEPVHFEQVGTGLRKKWRIYAYKNHNKITLALIRRIPRKWIKELNPYCPLQRGERRRLFRLEEAGEKNDEGRILS